MQKSCTDAIFEEISLSRLALLTHLLACHALQHAKPQAAKTAARQRQLPRVILIITSTLPDFVAALRADIDAAAAASASTSPLHSGALVGDAHQTHKLLRATLRNLAAAPQIRVVSVTSVPALLAYLSGLNSNSDGDHDENDDDGNDDDGAGAHDFSAEHPKPRAAADGAGQNLFTEPRRGHGQRLLVISSPLALHRTSAAWSAQGLSRCMSVAVDAAARMRRRLVVLECCDASVDVGVGTRDAGASAGAVRDGNETEATEATIRDAADPGLLRHGRDGHDDVSGAGEGEQREWDPWQHEVPMLNATTRTIGSAGFGLDGRVLGRRVKAGDVIGRWCRKVRSGQFERGERQGTGEQWAW